jgi:hypothetical protein
VVSAAGVGDDYTTLLNLIEIMGQRKAIAEIAVDPSLGWVLPGFGGKKSDRFRYQAYAHFEKDKTWGQRTWTLLVDLAKMPDAGSHSVEATVYFMVPEAPQHLLDEGARFELLHGENHYTHGVIKRVFEVGSNREYFPST